MAGNFSILVKEYYDIEHLAETIGRFIGHRLTKSLSVEWNLYQTETMGLHLSAFDACDFENDQGIRFEQYSILIDIQGLDLIAANPYCSEWPRLFSLVLASAMAQQLECECLVVENLQHIIAAFPALA